MLQCKIKDIAGFKSIFKKLEEIMLEITLECDEDGIRFRALDKSHTLFVDCTMNTDYFDEYECEDPLKICVDTTELNKVLGRLKTKQEVYVKSNNVAMTFTAVYNDNKSNYVIKLLNEVNDIRIPPNLSYDCNFHYKFDNIKEAIKDCELYSNKVQFNVDHDKFNVTCDGNMGNFHNQYTLDEDIGVTKGSQFSLEKVKCILNADKISKAVTLHLSEDMPLQMDLIDEGILIKYLIAPMIDVSEDE